MIKIGIVGGTGYTGVELLRLLATHPHGAMSSALTLRVARIRASGLDLYGNPCVVISIWLFRSLILRRWAECVSLVFF